MRQKLTKAELRSGMVLEFEDGKLGMVLLKTFNGDVVSGETWFPLDDLHEDFTRTGGAKVTKIYLPDENRGYLYSGLHNKHLVIWQREE